MNKKIKVVAGLTGLTALGSVSFINHASATPQTFTGNVVADGPYGNIQVQITIDNGLITSITTPVQPSGQSAAYASFAIPTLVTEALAAQSANINAVSGASYISAAWKSSLASAIANAGSAIGTQTITPPPAPKPTSSTTPTPSTTFTPVANVSGNTVCTTQSPTPVSTTITTTTSSDPTPATTPSTIPSTTPSTTPSISPEPSESEIRSTPTSTPTIKAPQIGDSEGGADLVARTVTTSGNLTTTITITKVIIQNQIVNCTTTNTVTNTVNVPVPGPTVYVNVPGPTVTITPTPIDPVPPIVIGIPTHPIIKKTPAPKPKIILKKKTKFNPYNIVVINCQSGNSIRVIAGPQPSCPRGYIKVK